MSCTNIRVDPISQILPGPNSGHDILMTHMESRSKSTCGIVLLARMGSKRLPGKVTLPFWNGKSILALLLESIAERFGKSQIVLATTSGEADKQLCDEAHARGITFWKGSENDVLQRCIGAAKYMNWDACLRVCADNPFLSIDELFLLYRTSHEWDYASYFFSDGLPAIRSHCGFFAEWVKVSSLERCALSTVVRHHEHVTSFIYENPSLFRIRRLSVPLEFLTRRIRLTVDTEKDFKLAQEIYEERYLGHMDKLSHLLEFMAKSPLLLDQMESCIQAHPK